MPGASGKPTIYVLLTTKTTLSRFAGDAINEFRLYERLSEIFEVYYNNDLYSSDKNTIGMSGMLGPNRHYDFYYVRNNRDVFLSIDGFKISFAYPYDEAVFAAANALFVYTNSWKKHLQQEVSNSKDKLKFIYNGHSPNPSVPVINVGQSMDHKFLSIGRNVRHSFPFHCCTTFAKSFGYYGNLSKDLYPLEAFKAIQEIYSCSNSLEPIILLAGRFRKDSFISYRNSIYLGDVPYVDMPLLLDATTAILTNESALNHCLGSQKVVDAISRGVPVLCKPFDVFLEQLGENYPCFFADSEEAKHLSRRLIEDADFYSLVKNHVISRRPYYTKSLVANNMRQQFIDARLI